MKQEREEQVVKILEEYKKGKSASKITYIICAISVV